jgi:polyhydroxybutyrate depolymerase
VRSLLRLTGILLAILLLSAALVWWWYLRAESMAPPALPGVLERGVLQFDGKRRSWLTYVPAAKAERPPLLLVMHGSLGDAEGMRATITRFGFDVLAERHGFVVVYPDGYERHWNDCRAGADYAANLENIDDVGFLRALVATMVEEQGVDPARVFATGLSNGGQMAYRLGLEAPDLVAGIAAVAANLPKLDNMDCEPVGQAVAALVMNGTMDPVNPYEGGLVEIFGNSSRGEVMSALETARYWAALAGYSGPGESRSWVDRAPDDATSVESIDWLEPGGIPVSLVTIIGGGHTVPHPLFRLPRILGPTSHELDATEVIWRFFSSVPASAP